MSTTQLSSATQDRSSKSTSSVSGAVDVTNSMYTRLIKWVLALVAIKYQSLTTDPFQEHRAGMLIFLTAIFCHAIAPTAAKPSWLTIILFHVYGIIALEAVLWVLVTQLLWFIIIDVFILLVALMYYHKDICKLLSALMYYHMGICKLLSTCYQKIFGPDGLNNAGLEAQGGIASGPHVTGIKMELGNSSV